MTPKLPVLLEQLKQMSTGISVIKLLTKNYKCIAIFNYFNPQYNVAVIR